MIKQGKISSLHILNGDAMQILFSHAFTNEEFIVWREAFCQGPISYDLTTPTIRTKRKAYLESLDPSILIAPHTYLIEELIQFNWKEVQNIYLWFEPDMFCQINQIAAISFLSRIIPSAKIFALPISYFDRISKPVFSSFNNQDFISAQNIFHWIDKTSIKAVDKLWVKICCSSWENIKLDLSNFPFLNKRIYNWLSQTSSYGIGAKILEEAIIATCQNPINKNNLIGQMLRDFSDLGYGDLQLNLIITGMIKNEKLFVFANDCISSKDTL